MNRTDFRRATAVVALTGCATLLACSTQPPATTTTAKTPNKFAANATLRQIATAQDERNAAALLPFLAQPEVQYRREAALALA
ncbi:hypothetical protein, partial [Hymenobacter sp. AT01-02]|uniref:hypothetical protein n=1 Tax=Hymenobacter sp. AT01-02 TaxID=1571877 RepID=UPI00191C49BC